MPRGSHAGIAHAAQFRWPSWRERFEANVDRSPGYGPWGDCHLWTGSVRGRNRYGVIVIHGKPRGAHRVAFLLDNGRWPVNLALHHCDIPTCVNPDHIYDGTHSDNNRDARQRGRATHSPPIESRARGVGHGNAKLTEAQVLEIRWRHDDGWSIKSLAEHYNRGWSTIDKVVKRQTWRHI